jgi:hypothetical protein
MTLCQHAAAGLSGSAARHDPGALCIPGHNTGQLCSMTYLAMRMFVTMHDTPVPLLPVATNTHHL